MIPKAPTKATIAALGDKAKVVRFAHGYHMLLRDLDAKAVWSEIVDWIDSTDETKVSGR